MSDEEKPVCWLAWQKGMTHDDYVRSALTLSECADDDHEIHFQLCHDFIHAFKALDDVSAEAVLEVLNIVPITTVKYVGATRSTAAKAGGGDRRCPFGRLSRLFGTLGSLATLTTFYFSSDRKHEYDNWVCQHGVLQLRSITQFWMTCLAEHDFQVLAACLTGHPTLQRVSFKLSTASMSLLLPSVRTIPNLTNVRFLDYCGSKSAKQDADAVCDLLRSNLPISVVFDSVNCLSSELAFSFDATVSSLDLRRCNFYEAITTASTLCKARLQHLKIDSPLFHVGDSNMFLGTLTEGLPTMPCLRTLEYSYNCQLPCDFAVEHSVVSLMRAAARCPLLEELWLELPFYTEAMNQSLATECIGKDKRLQKISVRCPPLNVSNNPSAQLLGLGGVYHAVLLSDSVQTLIFEPNCTIMPKGCIDPWNADCVKMLAAALRLNRVGCQPTFRPIYAPDSLRILEAVADDLDCIYLYVRRRPLAFDAVSGTSVPAASPPQPISNANPPTGSVSVALYAKPRWRCILDDMHRLFLFKK